MTIDVFVSIKDGLYSTEKAYSAFLSAVKFTRDMSVACFPSPYCGPLLAWAQTGLSDGAEFEVTPGSK